QAEDGIRDFHVTGVQTCALPISTSTVILPPRTVAVVLMASIGALVWLFNATDGTPGFPARPYPTSTPAMVAVVMLASVPASTARRPSCAISDVRLGASGPMPPIWVAMEEKLAKPQSAKVAMTSVLGRSVPAPICSAMPR